MYTRLNVHKLGSTLQASCRVLSYVLLVAGVQFGSSLQKKLCKQMQLQVSSNCITYTSSTVLRSVGQAQALYDTIGLHIGGGLLVSMSVDLWLIYDV